MTSSVPCIIVILYVVVVVAALESLRAGSSIELVQQALGAIRSLSFDNATNIRALVAAGACTGWLLLRSSQQCYTFLVSSMYRLRVHNGLSIISQIADFFLR